VIDKFLKFPTFVLRVNAGFFEVKPKLSWTFPKWLKDFGR